MRELTQNRFPCNLFCQCLPAFIIFHYPCFRSAASCTCFSCRCLFVVLSILSGDCHNCFWYWYEHCVSTITNLLYTTCNGPLLSTTLNSSNNKTPMCHLYTINLFFFKINLLHFKLSGRVSTKIWIWEERESADRNSIISMRWREYLIMVGVLDRNSFNYEHQIFSKKPTCEKWFDSYWSAILSCRRSHKVNKCVCVMQTDSRFCMFADKAFSLDVLAFQLFY